MTLQNRAQERRNKIIKTAWSGLVARIVTIAVSLLMVPLAIHYLGKEQYGLWVAVSSLIAMLGFMDGGAGNAVINLVAHASGAKNHNLGNIVSTAFFVLAALALTGCLLFLTVFPFVSWGKLLGVTEINPQSNLDRIVGIVGLSFFLSMLLTLVGKIQRGLQEGNLDNFWTVVGSILSLLLVYIAIQKDAGLVGFVIAFLSGPLLAYLMSTIHYLFFRRKDLCPLPGKVDRSIAKNLFAVSGMFFVLQIAVIVQTQADNVIIANMLGIVAVTNYSICMKLFLMVPMLFNLLLTPLWPAYREAIAGSDMQWVKQIFVKSMYWALSLSIPAAVVLIIIGRKVLELWIGEDITPSIELIVGCGIWMIFCTVGGALAALFNAMQLIKIQIIAALLTAILNVALSIYLIKIYGVAGAVFGSAIAWFLCTLIPYLIVLRKVLIKQNQAINS